MKLSCNYINNHHRVPNKSLYLHHAKGIDKVHIPDGGIRQKKANQWSNTKAALMWLPSGHSILSNIPLLNIRHLKRIWHSALLWGNGHGQEWFLPLHGGRDLSVHYAWDLQCLSGPTNYLSSKLIRFTVLDTKTWVIRRVIWWLEKLIAHWEVYKRCKDDSQTCVTLRHNDPFNSHWDLLLTVVLKLLSTAFHIGFGTRVRFIMNCH